VPPGEAIEIPYEHGKTLFAYFVRAPFDVPRQPVLIAFGGLDSFKDEMWFMVGRGALQRGISVLMVDGPGQGGTLRRHGLVTRHDYEVPVGRCIDWLLARDDVDPRRIAVSGSSLGGYYAARAGSKEPRLAATISHGAVWDVHERWKERDDNHGLAGHIRWVFGARNMAEAAEIAKPFKLEGVLDEMKCPYLICHGGHDVLGVKAVTQVYEYAKQGRCRRHAAAHERGRNRRRALPARQSDARPGDHARLARRPVRDRPARAEELASSSRLAHLKCPRQETRAAPRPPFL
jgi:prolyl oligopeptidase family protein